MVNVIIPMAGEGSRFPKDQYLPKPLIDVNGKPMIVRAIESLGIVGQYHFIIRQNEYTHIVKDIISKTVPNPKFVEITDIPVAVWFRTISEIGAIATINDAIKNAWTILT
mgnify:CR=1 FL=1